MKIRNFDKRILIIIGVASAFLFFTFKPKQRLMINLTDSVPVGVYFMEYDREIKPGDFVAFLPTGGVGEMMRSRGYISDNTPLIKVVSGTEGDRYCVDAKRDFTINGTVIGTAFDTDSLKQPLPRLDGCSIVPAQNFLVTGYGLRSFDSRYFGPISRKLFVAKLTPIWTKSAENLTQTEEKMPEEKRKAR